MTSTEEEEKKIEQSKMSNKKSVDAISIFALFCIKTLNSEAIDDINLVSLRS